MLACVYVRERDLTSFLYNQPVSLPALWGMRDTLPSPGSFFLPVAFVLLHSWDSTLSPCYRDFLLHIFFFTLISLLSVVLCPSTLYRPNRRAEPWIWSCKESRSAVCLSHEISSITRLCPLPLQGVKNRFALFYHQRVKGFFKNLYLEATSGKQLEKLLTLHDKNKQINSGAEKEAQTKGSHVLWQRDFMRTQPSYRGNKQWKYNLINIY